MVACQGNKEMYKRICDITAMAVVLATGLFVLIYIAKKGDNIEIFDVFLSAFFGYAVGIICIEMVSERGKQKNNIKTAISFCDELMNDSCKYLSKCSDKNEIEMAVLKWRIRSYNRLIDKIIQDDFHDKLDIKEAWEPVNVFVNKIIKDTFNSNSDIKKELESVSGAKEDKEPVSGAKEDKSSINSIIELRLIFFKQQNLGACEQFWNWVKRCWNKLLRRQ